MSIARTLLVPFICAGVVAGAAVASQPEAPATSSPPAPGIDGICESVNATVLAGGFQFTEGPLWHDGRWHFVDLSAGKMWALNADGTGKEEIRSTRGGAGLNVDHEGRVLLTQFAGNVERLEGETWVVVASEFEGARLSRPNDVVARSDGNVYFTAFGGASDPGGGVFRMDPEGELHRIDKTLGGPNGITLSPDERTLYVSDYGARRVHSLSLDEKGAPSGEIKLFADLTTLSGAGMADGMAVDEHGNLYATGPGGISVWSPEGKQLGLIPGRATNCAFGGEDGKTLFITAGRSVKTLAMQVRGAALGKVMGGASDKK